MKMSPEKSLHLTSLIIEGLWKRDLVEYSDEDLALRVGRQGADQFQLLCQELEQHVVSKIKSLKRSIVEDSPEWNTLYLQYYDEELGRKGLRD